MRLGLQVPSFTWSNDQGIDQAIFSLPNVADLEPFDVLATRIIPEVEKIPVAGR
jgi:hypothetical protein